MTIKENWAKWIPAFVFGTLMIIIYKTIDNFDQVLDGLRGFMKIASPFFFAILIVYFLYIPCKKMEELYSRSKNNVVKKKARVFGVLTIYLLLLLAIGLFTTIVVPIIIQSILDVASNLPTYSNFILEKIEQLPADSIISKETLVDAVNDLFNQMLNPSKMEQFTQGIMNLANGVINAVISLTVSLYILLDRENLAKSFNHAAGILLPKTTYDRLYKYLNKINNVLFTFIASKGVDSIINFVSVSTILLLLGVKYALLLGLIAGIANFIPYLGSLLAVIFITIVTFITGTPVQALYTAIFLAIFQQLDGNFIEPKIMGTTLEMSPILVIFAVVVGGAYFGIVGMFLGVPIAAITKQILSEYLEMKKEKLDEQPET